MKENHSVGNYEVAIDGSKVSVFRGDRLLKSLSQQFYGSNNKDSLRMSDVVVTQITRSHRVCIVCGKSIGSHSKSGACQKCWRKLTKGFVEIASYKRKKKGGKRKTVVVLAHKRRRVAKKIER